MSINVKTDTKIIVQGTIGFAGTNDTKQMCKDGRQIVTAATPGAWGTTAIEAPEINAVEDAVNETGATVSIIYVPAPFAADASMEATDAGIELAICITEHIPVIDMIKVKEYMADKPTRLIGPNCPGVITADETKIGI